MHVNLVGGGIFARKLGPPSFLSFFQRYAFTWIMSDNLDWFISFLLKQFWVVLMGGVSGASERQRSL